MSSSAVQQPIAATRRHLTDRQAQTVHRLTEAAVAELVESGYGSFTVRLVAARAGVAPATAYTYFASKEHLVAEVFWRRFEAQDAAAPPLPDTNSRTPTERATDVLLGFALVVADETELAAACTVALLADDVEVRELRTRIGLELHRRLTSSIGADAPGTAVTTLELAITGLLLQVGTGHLAYDQVPAMIADVATTVLGGTR